MKCSRESAWRPLHNTQRRLRSPCFPRSRPTPGLLVWTTYDAMGEGGRSSACHSATLTMRLSAHVSEKIHFTNVILSKAFFSQNNQARMSGVHYRKDMLSEGNVRSCLIFHRTFSSKIRCSIKMLFPSENVRLKTQDVFKMFANF